MFIKLTTLQTDCPIYIKDEFITAILSVTDGDKKASVVYIANSDKPALVQESATDILESLSYMKREAK